MRKEIGQLGNIWVGTNIYILMTAAPFRVKNEYDDPTAAHQIGGYANCEMNRNSGESGNSSMPPLVAMEGMQANQEAEFMSMNIARIVQ